MKIFSNHFLMLVSYEFNSILMQIEFLVILHIFDNKVFLYSSINKAQSLVREVAAVYHYVITAITQ